MAQNHFRSHFSPFQINTQLRFKKNITKWLPATILDDRKSLSNAFLAIFRSIRNFIYLFVFTKWLPAAILDDRKSSSITFPCHFKSIHNLNFFLFCSQNGCRRPFWMTENHFRSHFSPFSDQYATFFFKSQNGFRRPFWMTENHFQMHFAWQPFWMTENHFRSHFSPFQINTQLFLKICSQNCYRRPFWMAENHFRSHFSPF